MRATHALNAVRTWLQGLSRRERLMVLVLTLAALGYAADSLVFVPQQKRTQALQTELTRQRGNLAVLSQALEQARANRSEAVLAAQRAERDALREDVAYAQALVQAAHQEVRVGATARALIAQTRGVTLRSLQTRPGQPFYKSKAVPAKPGAAAAPPPASNGLALPELYLHAVDISVEGSYDEVVRFLRRLEGQDTAYFWPSVSLNVTTHPTVNVRATVHTLSVNPEAPLE